MFAIMVDARVMRSASSFFFMQQSLQASRQGAAINHQSAVSHQLTLASS